MTKPKCLIISLALMLLASGCDHRELCYDHSHMEQVKVMFDWKNAPEANPSTMVVHLYSETGEHLSRYEFTDRNGGHLSLRPGRYMVLFHNGEMENVKERNQEKHPEYELFTPEADLLEPMSRDMTAPPRPSEVADEPVRKAPEQVWGGRYDEIEVRSGEEGQTVTLVPVEATGHYTVVINDVENLEENYDLSASISGMAESYSPASGGMTGEKVTFPLSLEYTDSHTLTARFYSFGHCPTEEGVHIFSVYTSEKIYYNFDVTGQLHEAADPHNILIVINGLKLPTVQTGMSPSVDDWSDVEDIYIEMQ